jgi:nucleotide-binding universal stress UspA family protein
VIRGNVNRFVVGVNNSRASRDALAWAYGTAIREGACLEIVTVYRPSIVVSPLDGYVVVDDPAARETARAMQYDAVRGVLGDDDTELSIECVIVLGEPASVLVDRAAGASLLVVGRRAGRWHRLLRPSTSTRCADRSTCPVVIVREQRPMSGHRYRAELRQLERASRAS